MIIKAPIIIKKKDKANFFKLKKMLLVLRASQVLGRGTNTHPGAVTTPSAWLSLLFFLALYQPFIYLQFVVVFFPVKTPCTSIGYPPLPQL